MEINKSLLDNLLEQAAANPRLRMNYELRTSALRPFDQLRAGEAQGKLSSPQVNDTDEAYDKDNITNKLLCDQLKTRNL